MRELKTVLSAVWESFVGAKRWWSAVGIFVVTAVVFAWGYRGWPALTSVPALKDLAVLVGLAFMFAMMFRDWWDLGIAFVGEDFWEVDGTERTRRLRKAAAPIGCLVGTAVVVIVYECYFGD